MKLIIPCTFLCFSIWLTAEQKPEGIAKQLVFIDSMLSPAIYVNHVFVTLDNKTYNDITRSGFMLKQFAPFEERTTNSNPGESWTGAYFYGEHTYFELFNVAKNPDFKTGESGIGFGVEREGEIDIVYERLKNTFSENVTKRLRTRKNNKGDVPWFYSTAVDYKDKTQSLFTWVMEYHPNYLKNMFPDLT